MRARPKIRVSERNFRFPAKKEYPASERQIALVKELAEKLGVDPPEKLTKMSCRQFINNHIRQRGKTNVDSVQKGWNDGDVD